MSSITTINGSDQISTSRTVINTNFSNLNNGKMETSVLDTDTTLAANSDAKVATQKAVKTYVDAVASPTGKSWNEYAASSNGTDSYSITVAGVSAYVVGQVYKFRADVANTGSASLNVNGLGAKTIKKNATSDLVTGDILAGQIVICTYDASGNMQLSSNSSYNPVKFGGTGVDGALSITSGTTTINVGAARVYVLNYSSISITGTGKLAFSNPHANGSVVVIKCQGSCTLTSSTAPMIDLSGMGAAAGNGATQASAGGSADGSDGTDGTTYGFLKTNKAGGSGSYAGGAVGTFVYPFVSGNINDMVQVAMKYPHIFIGAGGSGGRASWSSGGSGTVVSGAGGRGGGCLILEVGGALNFTTANGISVAGSAGTNGSNTGSPTISFAGGGGGGGGGSAFIFYNSLTAFTGTVNVAGGTGANAKVTGAPTLGGQGGGGGGSGFNAGGNGVAVPNGSSVDGQKVGADGGAGYELHALNTEF